VRVFVAIDLPEDVRRALGEFIAKIEKTCRGARWVRPEGIHITLKFIGETRDETIERTKVALAAVHSTSPVAMRFREVGYFPNAHHPRVFWAGIETAPNLAELAKGIEDRLESLGIAPENRPFRPHPTLARFKSEDGLAQLRQALDRLGPFEFGAAHASQFHLYRSELERGGAKYTRLASFDFVQAGQ
jgi:2'-5' RNA ligase